MRKWFVFGVSFICIYLFFLVKMIPVNILMNYISLPENVVVQGVSGTVWQSKVDQIQVSKIQINRVEAELSFLSLLMLKPETLLAFGDAFLSGPEGAVTIAIDDEFIKLTNADIMLGANEIAQQLILPLPVIAKGDISIIIDEIVVAQSTGYQCSKASGEIQWRNAAVIALDQKIKIGNLKATISCQEGRLTLAIFPQNNLGLSFTGYINKNGKVKGNGYLTPGEKFPNTLKSALPFLGKKDGQGRYQLII